MKVYVHYAITVVSITIDSIIIKIPWHDYDYLQKIVLEYSSTRAHDFIDSLFDTIARSYSSVIDISIGTQCHVVSSTCTGMAWRGMQMKSCARANNIMFKTARLLTPTLHCTSTARVRLLLRKL